jgi:hypothetical protein
MHGGFHPLGDVRRVIAHVVHVAVHSPVHPMRVDGRIRIRVHPRSMVRGRVEGVAVTVAVDIERNASRGVLDLAGVVLLTVSAPERLARGVHIRGRGGRVRRVGPGRVELRIVVELGVVVDLDIVAELDVMVEPQVAGSVQFGVTGISQPGIVVELQTRVFELRAACLIELGVARIAHLGVMVQLRAACLLELGVGRLTHLGVVVQLRAACPLELGVGRLTHLGVMVQFGPARLVELGVAAVAHLGVVLQFRVAPVRHLGVVGVELHVVVDPWTMVQLQSLVQLQAGLVEPGAMAIELHVVGVELEVVVDLGRMTDIDLEKGGVMDRRGVRDVRCRVRELGQGRGVTGVNRGRHRVPRVDVAGVAAAAKEEARLRLARSERAGLATGVPHQRGQPGTLPRGELIPEQRPVGVAADLLGERWVGGHSDDEILQFCI